MGPVRALSPESDNPVEVALACLDDGALRDEAQHALAVFALTGEAGADVGVEHDQSAVTLAADPVTGQAAEKRRRHAQARQCPRRVEGPPARHRVLRAVGAGDHVDQGFAADDDHGYATTKYAETATTR